MYQSKKLFFLSPLLILVFFTISVFSAPGDLDLTFNSSGFNQIGFTNGNDFAQATAIQADGKILAVGYSYNGSNNNVFSLVRYNPNGSLDTTFDGDGKVLTQIGRIDDEAFAVAIQSDGKIVVAGYSVNASGYDYALVRYNLDGSLDTTFDSDGKVVTPIGTNLDIAYSIAIQSDGKILAAGYSFNSSINFFSLARYNTNGSLDTTFDSDGKVFTAIGGFENYARAVKVQADGKIVAVGYSSEDGSNHYFSLVRYNTNGSLDTTFDSDGIAVADLQIGSDIAYSATLQPDGKILVAGSSANLFGEKDFAVARFNMNGSLDTSFDSDGVVTNEITSFSDVATSIVIQIDGKIVAAGYSGGAVITDLAVARYNTDGSLDTSLDSDGKLTTSVVSSITTPFGAAVQTDGKIILTANSLNVSDYDFTVIRYNSNGSFDTTFDSDGTVTTDICSAGSTGTASTIQSDGKIVIVGMAFIDVNNRDFGLVRYNTNGSIDTTFDSDGKVVTPIGTLARATAVAMQADGKIIVAGMSSNGLNDDFAVARYNTNGSLDTTFDFDGKVTTAIGSGNDTANAVAIQADGKIVVAGGSALVNNFDFALVRYNTDGSLDTSFDGDGKVFTPIGTGFDRALSMAIQPDGKILVAGFSIDSSYDFAVARYNLDGSLDTTFDLDGKVITNIGTENFSQANSILVQTNGKILVTGFCNALNKDFALVRYNSNGSLDTTFDGDGKVTTPIGIGEDVANSAVVQVDGKIIAAGYSKNGTTLDFAIVKYNSDGSLDSSFADEFNNRNAFGSGGKVTIDMSNGYDTVTGVRLDPTNKIILTGTSGGLFTAARLQNLAPTAASANLSGKVVDQFGRGISRANVTLTKTNGETITLLTNSFGNFSFPNLEVGGFYIVNVRRKGYFFKENTITHQLFEDFDGIQFLGESIR